MSTFNLLNLLSHIFLASGSLGPIDLSLASNAGCILIPYMAKVFTQMSSWLCLMTSYDRILLMDYKNMTEYNKRSPLLREKIKLLRIILILFLTICLINMAGFFFHLESLVTFDPIKNETDSKYQCESSPTIFLVIDVITVTSRDILPLILSIVCISRLINKLMKLKIIVRTLKLKREYIFTFTIVMLNVLFIFSEIFSIITTLLINIHGYNQTYISTSSNESAIASFLKTVSVCF